MSVVGDVVGIIACVAGVISAYRDGGAIIERIKARRAEKRAPPPPRLLEETIDQAPEEIEKEKRRGVTRFGKQFEDGDHIAVITLQQITIQLQGTLLEKLRNVAFDDELTDFTPLVDAADLGRDMTIGALLELRQRLLQAQPINEMQHVKTGDSKHSAVTSMKELPPPPTESSETSPAPTPRPARPQRTWTREYSTSHDTSGEEDSIAGADDYHYAHRKHRASLLGFLNRQHRSHSGSHENVPKVAEEARRAAGSPTSVPFRPPKQGDVRETASAGGDSAGDDDSRQLSSTSTYQDLRDTPTEIWGSKSSTDRRDTIAVVPNGQALPVQPVRSLSNAPSVIQPPSLHHANTIGSTAIPTPTPDNEFLGFCKGAWKLQNGDRKGALQKCKEFNDGWSQSNVYYFACSHSKCAFAGHIAVDKIWDKVWTVESKGIKFRWPFLAKSHVPQTKVKDHQYAYQCMFCVFLGKKSPVYFGTDTYVDHVCEHRSQPVGDVILYKCRAIADHVAEDNEEFDVNLFPLTVKEQVDRRKSEVLPDELLTDGLEMKRSVTASDSMFGANEPWNEGLSDFHWGGDLETTEFE